MFCLRRTPFFTLNNIRSFETSSKLLRDVIVGGKTIGSYTDFELETWREKGRKCRMLKLGPNGIRALLISCPHDQQGTYGAIRLGVGTEWGSPIGIAHLLEHIIARCLPKKFPTLHGETSFNSTVYEFADHEKHFWPNLKSFSNILFGPDSIGETIQKCVDNEVNRLDAEYHLRRTNSQGSIAVLSEIWISEKFVPQPIRFVLGNRETLTTECGTSILLSQLDHFRKEFYRKCSAYVCITSPSTLDDLMNEFKENFWICQNFQPEQTREQCGYSEAAGIVSNQKRVLVVKSDADDVDVILCFPSNEKLTDQESNTLIFIARLVELEGADGLLNYLLDKKIGMDVKVSLSEDIKLYSVRIQLCDMTRVHEMANIVNDYFKNMRKELQKLITNYADLENEDRIDFENKRFVDPKVMVEYNIEKDELSESDLFSTVNLKHAQHLIDKLILKNENRFCTVVTREPEKTLSDVFNVEDEGINEKTEKYFLTRYYVAATPVDLFETPENSALQKPEDSDFQKCCSMRSYTEVIYDSEELATSLLATAIKNRLSATKEDPIPIQLMKEDDNRRESICNSIEDWKGTVGSEYENNLNISINAINQNELSTVTCRFYQVESHYLTEENLKSIKNFVNGQLEEKRKEFGIYEFRIELQKNVEVEEKVEVEVIVGFTLWAKTVESRSDLCSEKMNEVLDEIISKTLDESELEMGEMFNRKIFIQIIGFKEYTPTVKPLEEEVEEWLDKYFDIFKTI